MITTVLLVDDEEDIRTLGEIILSDVGGWTAIVASTGVDAIVVASREKPDVILLDVMMPGMDGVMTLKKLRSNPETAGIPVIFMTAKVLRHEIEHYLKLGAQGVIAKPFDPIGLPKEISRIINDEERRP